MIFLLLIVGVWLHGNVTHVVDGDTVIIDNATKVRLAMVNTPELKNYGNYDAKKFVTDHCLNKDVKIKVDSGQPIDKYGRTVALIKCPPDTVTMNQLILSQDYGILIRHFCSISQFANLSWIKCPK